MTNQSEQAAAPIEPAAGTVSDVERQTSELTEAQAKAKEHYETYVRALAEADNVRKRAARDVEAASRFAIERFAGELLEGRDSLELGVAAGTGGDPARLVEGMEATLRLLNKAFEKSGVTVVDARAAVQSGVPRSHGHPAGCGPAAGHGSRRGPERLCAERPAPAPGPGRGRPGACPDCGERLAGRFEAFDAADQFGPRRIPLAIAPR